MTCRRIDLGAGVTSWSCGPRPALPACSSCSGPGAALTCQFELGGAKRGQCCGRVLCRNCAGQVEASQALCPPHRKLVAARGPAGGGQL